MKWFSRKNTNSNTNSTASKFNFDRLLQVNSRDPAIFTRNSINNLIDLSNIIEPSQIYNYLFSAKNDLLIENKDITENLNKEASAIKNLSDFLDFCNFNGIKLTEIEINKLNKNFETNKPVILANKLAKNLVSLSKKVNQIVESNKKNLIDENIYTLYLGAYYLNGKIEESFVNAPLLLYKVDIVFKANNICIHKVDPNPIINEKINFILEKQLKIKFDFKEEITYKSILDYKKYLNGFVMNINESFSDRFCLFEDKECEKLTIKNHVCLTLVEPTGGTIKKNIEEILRNKINPFEVNTRMDNIDKYENEVIESDDIIEINQKLNIYQKYAVKSALIQNTLIYGPPGTGKSEVIATIIANIIASYNSKPLSILVSSEKKVALDVISERIGAISSLSLIISDVNETEFYDRLKKYESLIRRTLNKRDLSNSHREYQAILESYQNLFSLIDNKLNNNVSFNDFLLSVTDINLVEFSEYYNNGYLAAIKTILDKQRFDQTRFFSFVEKFNHLISEYEDEFNILIMHKNFDSFDSKFLNDFIQKYDQSSKQDFIISTLITKNKIMTKKPLFGGTQKLILDVDQDRMIDLLKGLVSLNLHNLSREEIIMIKDFKLDFDKFNQFVIYSNFLDSIQYKSKYFKDASINNLFKEYINKRNLLNEANDKLIFDLYIHKKCSEINKLNDAQKNKIFELFGLCYLKNKPSINFVVKKYFDELKYLFPIWFASPEQVCSLIPNTQGIFNYGIFDEASQMFVEKAFPLVYRTKIKIVAGDDKQLQPSSFFMKKVDNDDFENQINTESLFEIANVCLWTKFYLKNHYRSKSAQLIKFSNEYFYENKLEFSTYNGFNLKPMIVYNVDGIWENNNNQKEIAAIIQILQNNQYLLNKKILVVSFNGVQSKLLTEAFNASFSSSKPWMDKVEDGSIVFCALEDVQGNEADIVILSISYAKSSDNKFRQFFGPLSQKNGQNRLNVAITRAKEQMYVVKSICGGDIKLSENESNNIFKFYLSYCDQFVVNNNQKEKPNSLASIVDSEIESNLIHDKILDNIIIFLESIKNTKTKNPSQYQFNKNYIIGNKLIDIVLYDIKLKKVVFGLKINNNLNRQLKANIQFLDEVQFLNDLNYPIYTLNIVDWFLKNKSIQEEITEQFNV